MRLTAYFSQISAGFGSVKQHAVAFVDAPPPDAVDARVLRAVRVACPLVMARRSDDDACAVRCAHHAAHGRSSARSRAERVENRPRAAGVRSGVENPSDDPGGTQIMRIDESIRGIAPFK